MANAVKLEVNAGVRGNERNGLPAPVASPNEVTLLDSVSLRADGRIFLENRELSAGLEPTYLRNEKGWLVAVAEETAQGTRNKMTLLTDDGHIHQYQYEDNRWTVHTRQSIYAPERKEGSKADLSEVDFQIDMLTGLS